MGTAASWPGLEGSMRIRPFVVLAVLALGLAAPGAALAQAEVTHLLRLWAQGAAVFADTCPLSNPEVDTACTAYIVFYDREDLPEGGFLPADLPGGRAKALFNAFVEIDDVVVHPDGTADGSVRASGVAFDANGTYDKMHLSEASVEDSVQMSDGSVIDLDLHWVYDGSVVKSGNDGLESEDEGLPALHFRDPCTTANFNDHQKYAHGRITGTIGAIDVESFGFRDAYIFNNWFHWTIVTHGNCVV
jgi:hypothetical protein